MAVKRKKVAAQRDMFPARKKLAEAEECYSNALNIQTDRKIEDLSGGLADAVKAIEYLRGFTKADSERLDLIVAQTSDRLNKLGDELTEVRSNVQRLAHAVELLNKRGARPKTTPKEWTSEEYIRLDGEYDLMLRVDGEVDHAVLMDIHNCTVIELTSALKHLRKPGYEA